MNGETLISVACPLANDQPIIADFLRQLSAALASKFQYFEIVLVDNGSLDGTALVVEQTQKDLPNVRLVRLSREYPHDIALSACLDNAIGDYVVLMDPRVDPVNMVLPLLERSLSGFHVVIGKRENMSEGPWLRRALRKPFYWMATKILGFHLHPMASQFRVLSRQAVNSITRVRNKNRSLRYLNAMIGFEPAYVPYTPNAQGTRERSSLRAAASAVDMVVSNSAAPLRFASALALLGSVLNLLYFGYILVVSLIKNKVAEGWITTNVSHTSMFFLLFIVLSILAEYIARILEESQDRPLYFVDYETNSTTISVDPKGMRDRLNVV